MENRAKHLVFLGCGLLCAAALVVAVASAPSAAEGPQAGASAPDASTANFPVASGARLAGDGKQTRFILDLDRKIEFRAFPLADPYRVVVDIPQVNFQLAAGTGSAGRGLVKAFRYGAPPHGGCAAGIDRIVMLLADEQNIREVIMFPMNQRAEDLILSRGRIIGSGARTALADAKRLHAQALHTERSDIRAALQSSRDAVAAAQAALQRAKDDMDEHRRRQQRQQMGNAAGNVVTGMVLGQMLSGGRGFGGGFGGGGFGGGSFGGDGDGGGFRGGSF